jgi:hypothetical protein
MRTDCVGRISRMGREPRPFIGVCVRPAWPCKARAESDSDPAVHGDVGPTSYYVLPMTLHEGQPSHPGHRAGGRRRLRRRAAVVSRGPALSIGLPIGGRCYAGGARGNMPEERLRMRGSEAGGGPGSGGGTGARPEDTDQGRAASGSGRQSALRASGSRLAGPMEPAAGGRSRNYQ